MQRDLTVVVSALHNHESGSKVEDISAAAVEVADVAHPEMFARSNEVGFFSTRTVIAPTWAGSVKSLLTATKKRLYFKHDIGIQQKL